MDLSWRFDLWFALLPRSPRDAGRVEQIVLRPTSKERVTPRTIAVDPERGIVGDRWFDDPRRSLESQVSLMNVNVLRSIAGGEERMQLAGDNLVVDLDLCEDNLPAGTRLLIGTAELEITSKPHRGCRSFVERFGESAAKRVARAGRRGRRGRGMFARIVRAGTIQVGDAIAVCRPDTNA